MRWPHVLLALVWLHSTAAQGQPNVQLNKIVLPPGFGIQLYTKQNVTGARSIAIGGSTSMPIVYVSSDGAGVVSAIVDRGNSGMPTVCTLLTGLNIPEGLAYHNGSIYVGQVTNITRYDNVDAAVMSNCTGLGAPVLIATPFPETSDHNTRHLEIGPDNKLYVAYGAPENVDLCGMYGNINACSIIRMNLDGSDIENYLVGIRNTVGFAWQPGTEQFFFNMIERDLLGDNLPDDVLFMSQGTGSNYSWPYCHRQGLGDPYYRDLGPGMPFADPDVHNLNQTQIIASNPSNVNQSLNNYCNASTIAPLLTYGPHVSPLGLKFYTGAMFPAEYSGSLFAPQHGSWDRTFDIGYRLTNVKLGPNNLVTDYQLFATGWLQNQNTTQQSVWDEVKKADIGHLLKPNTYALAALNFTDYNAGRPVATAELPDGSLLLSDDYANAVYRISYSASSPGSAPATSTPSSPVGAATG